MRTVRVQGFVPSERGFHFANAFPRGPLLRVGFVPVGNAANGLCGGMAFAARDLFEAGRLPPPDREPPPAASPLYRYLVRRLFASFDLPLGPLRYLAWMYLPKGDRLGVAGLARRTIGGHWPRVRRDLDEGRLCALGLVRARLNPFELGRNHQVLAYGYDLDGSGLVVHVYDPNRPDDDAIALRLDTSHPRTPTVIEYEAGGAPVHGFFRTSYRAPRGGGPSGLGRATP